MTSSLLARSAEGAFPLAELPDRHVLADAFVHAAQATGIPFAADPERRKH
jgi:hypothetical protein